MSVMEEIESNSDILRYISGGTEDDVTEDSFIVVDRQTEFDERSPNEQEAREKFKLEQMMTSMKLSVSSESGSASTSQTTDQTQGRLEDSYGEQEPSSMLNSVATENETMEEIESMKAEKIRLTEQLNILNDKLRSEIPLWTKRVQTVQAESDECKSTIQQLKVEIIQLKTSIEEKEKIIEDLKTELTASRARRNSQEFVDVKSTDTELAKMKKELEENLKVNAELEQLYQLEVMQSNELKEKLRETEGRTKEEDRISGNDEAISLKAVVNSLEFEMQMQIQKLEEKESTLEGTNKMLRMKDEEIAMLKDSMNILDGKMSQLRKDATEKFIQLTKKNEESEHAVEEMSMAKQRCEEHLRLNADRLNSMSLEIQQLRANGGGDENSQNELRRLRQQYAVLDKENTELRTQIAALSTENDSIEHWKEQCQLFQTDYQQVVTQKNQLNTRNLELSQELENMRGELEKKTKDLDDLHNEHTRLAQEHLNRNDDRKIEQPNVPDGAAAASAPSASSSNSASDVPPCPLCSQTFGTVAQLVEHSASCGDSPYNSRYGSQLDPFEFVPNQ